jgi:catechol 2,3-dioxygenase-like lactoylglutathione lyase family enzyme
MAIEFNHTIVHARNKQESAKFLSDILGLAKPEPFGIFLVVRTANGVSLDFIETTDKIEPQHYAFLVSEAEFDQIFSRIVVRGLTYWPEPTKRNPGQINTHDGGRGLYFEDPSSNFLEIITRPYGG